MTHAPYPRSIAEIEPWARQHRATGQEARRRLVQFVVMEAVAQSAIGRRIAFKGGNALMLAHGSPRSTLDLDFTATGDVADDHDELRRNFDDAVTAVEQKFGLRMRVQSVKRKPKRAGASTWATYELKIGYQLPGDRRFRSFDADPRPVSDVVKVEVSLNDLVCETTEETVLDATIRTCSLNDIVAEKLRALLQQSVRNRNRCQDGYDIARIMRTSRKHLDLARIKRFLIKKARARGIDARASAFDTTVRERAHVDYEFLAETISDSEFIEFEAAWDLVLELVSELGLPE